MSRAGFGSSSAGYRAFAAKGFDVMADFLPMGAKLFSNANLNKDCSHNLTTWEVVKLQTLWTWAYCRRSMHGNSDDINWKITQSDLASWAVQESVLILKIWNEKEILEPIGGKFSIDKVDFRNYTVFHGDTQTWVRAKHEMRNRADLDGCARALFGVADGTRYVPAGDLNKQVFNQEDFPA